MSLPELPRYLHKPERESLLVKTPEAYEAAIADGWTVHNQFNGHAIDFEEAAPEVDVEIDAPKRGRKSKAH